MCKRNVDDGDDLDGDVDGDLTRKTLKRPGKDPGDEGKEHVGKRPEAKER